MTHTAIIAHLRNTRLSRFQSAFSLFTPGIFTIFLALLFYYNNFIRVGLCSGRRNAFKYAGIYDLGYKTGR